MTQQPTLEKFLNDVKNHELTIHQNDGVDRHLIFKNPNDCNQHFNITTFPNYLVITGDMGSLVFSRQYDMFDFFRSDDLSINPSYWGEKIESTSWEAKNASVLEFDIEKVKESAREYLNDFLADNDLSNEDEGKLLVEFRRKILCSENEFEIREAVNDFDCCGFDFSEFWGCEQRVFTYRYIWLCYAIVWGIKKFDELNKE